MDLRDKVALITGGGVRVGRAIALGLAGAGAHTIVHYNSSAGSAQETAAKARQLGVEAFALQANLADPENAVTLVREANDRFGAVDVLVHAASPFVRSGLFDVTLESWRMLQAILVESFLVLVQGLAPRMIERGVGALIPILDHGAFEPWPNYLAHGVGKSALWALARSLAVELAPHVRVNAVVPGPVLPPPGYTEVQIARAGERTLVGRWGDPEDVAQAVLYLARSEYITGELIFVDGGQRWAHCRS